MHEVETSIKILKSSFQLETSGLLDDAYFFAGDGNRVTRRASRFMFYKDDVSLPDMVPYPLRHGIWYIDIPIDTVVIGIDTTEDIS